MDTQHNEEQGKQAPPTRRYYIAWSPPENLVAGTARVWARGTDAPTTLLTGMTRFDNELVSNPDGTPERHIMVAECTKACYIWVLPVGGGGHKTGKLFWISEEPPLVDVDLAYTPDEEPTQDPALEGEPMARFYGDKLPKCSSSNCNTEAVWEVPWDQLRATYYYCDTCFCARTPGRLDGTPKRLLLTRPGIDDE